MLGGMEMKMKRLAGVQAEVLGSHIKLLLLLLLLLLSSPSLPPSFLLVIIGTLQLERDMIGFAFLQQFSMWFEEWTQVGQEWC